MNSTVSQLQFVAMAAAAARLLPGEAFASPEDQL